MAGKNVITNNLFNAMKRAGTMTFTNQADILMKKQLYDEKKSKLISFNLHDNRIFIFSNKSPHCFKTITTETSSPEQSVILNILTTRGFRVLRSIYFLFRVLDNSIMVVLIILSLLQGKLVQPKPSQYAIFSVIGLELFYDVMLNVSKYWGLQRLSFVIGLLLYALYYGVLRWMDLDSDLLEEKGEYQLCLMVVTFRLCAFLIEEMVDIGIDLCLHNVLVGLDALIHQNTVDEESSPYDRSTDVHSSTTTDAPHQNLKLLGITKDDSLSIDSLRKSLYPLEELKELQKKNCIMPSYLKYEGSFFAWGGGTVRRWEDCTCREEFNGYLIIALFICGIIPSIAGIVLLCGLVAIAAVIS
jgi:hypothetical protein